VHLLVKIHRQQPKIVVNPRVQRDLGMAVGGFCRSDPDLFGIFETRQIEARSGIAQHVADALGPALNRGEIQADFDVVGLGHDRTKAGAGGFGNGFDHAGNSYPIADSISTVRCTAGRAIMR
jgi:hypothetical protein